VNNLGKDIITHKELVDLVKPDLEKIAKNIAKDMEQYSLNTIVRFYLDYNPLEYKRRYAMPFILTTSKIKKKRDGYEIIVKYISDDLSFYHGHRDDKVFDGPFLQGYHGGPIARATGWRMVKGTNGKKYKKATGFSYSPAPQMTPSPWERILDYAKYVYNGEEIK
jgi:hypothetical protein